MIKASKKYWENFKQGLKPTWGATNTPIPVDPKVMKILAKIPKDRMFRLFE